MIMKIKAQENKNLGGNPYQQDGLYRKSVMEDKAEKSDHI